MAGLAASKAKSNHTGPAVLTAIGLMSGTSMDGIDAGLVDSDGIGVTSRGMSLARAYPADLRADLQDVVARMAAADDPLALRRDLREFEKRLTSLNAEAVEALLRRAGLERADIDVIGYHGQTVLHRPERAMTIQLGLGQRLAALTGIAVVADFRAADVAAGGEGAPLAPAYHAALAAGLGIAPLAVVNIGGVANVTWLDGGHDPIAFDTGPGNALIDDLVLARTGRAMDEGGRLAAAGRVDEAALARLLDHAYFARPAPKSLDRNAFSSSPVAKLSLEDAAATLAAFTARTIACAARHFPRPPARWVVCGGGRHNGAIMAALARHIDGPVLTAEQAGWRGDDVEAEAFAYLAVRSLKGLPLSWPSTTGVPEPRTGGVLHRPPAQRTARVLP